MVSVSRSQEYSDTQVDSVLQNLRHKLENRDLDEAESLILKMDSVVMASSDSTRKSIFLNNQALLHYYRSEYFESIRLFSKSRSFLKADNGIKNALRLRNIALAYYRLDNYSQSISYNERALEQLEGTGDSTQIAAINNSLGLIFNRLEEFEKAIHPLKLAYEFWQKNTSRRKAIVTNNLGNSFFGLAQWDSASYYYNLSLSHAAKGGFRYATPLNNLGETFLSLDQLDSAQHYISESISIKRENGNVRGIAYSSNVLAELLLRQRKYNLAEQYLDSAYATASEIGSVSILTKNFELRRVLYQRIGELQQALDVDLILDSMKQVVYNEEKLKTLELSARYDLQQKEQERQIAEQEAQLSLREKEVQEQYAKQNLIIAFVLGVFLLGTFILLYSVWKQRKQLRMLNATLDEQNQKINLLYQENFHFTRNSLSEIVAMLNRQTKRISEGAAKELLVAERLRIETVNLLYKQLFTRSKKDAEGVPMPGFLTSIVENTVDTILGFSHKVELRLSIDDVEMAREHALSVGILVNELTLNSCKYALNSESPCYSLELRQKTKRITLEVSDNGPGFPADLNWEQTDSFGFQLIHSLAADLQAEMKINTGNTGVNYYFSIPNEQPWN